MAEPRIETTPEAPVPVVVEKTSRLKSFQLNHPRTAKVVGLAAVTASVFGVLAWRNSKKDNDSSETATSDVPFDSSETA